MRRSWRTWITGICPDCWTTCRLIVDGTDNFETRFLLNDASIRYGIPWVYGGCIGAEGQTMTIVPGDTPCLRCVLRESPPPGTTPTCDTAGILGPIVNVIASFQACEAIKILSGQRQAVSRTLNVFDLWENRLRQINLDSLRGARIVPPATKVNSPGSTDAAAATPPCCAVVMPCS